MGKDNAREYVEKMFTDDEFLKEICRHGGFDEKASDDEKMALTLKAAGEMGYTFSEEEYTVAMEDYFKGKGIFGSIKAFAHMNKIIKAVKKEQR